MFQNFYSKIRNKKWYSYTMIAVSALLYTVAINLFIQTVGTFSAGMGAFSQLLTMAIKGLKNYFSFVYLALNIPLILIFARKQNAKFIIRTCWWLLVQTLIGLLFVIPSVHEALVKQLGFQNRGISDIRHEIWPIFVFAIIGAFMVSTSVALSWKFGGSTAGTDIIVYYYSTKKKKPIGSIMFMLSSAIMIFSFSVSVIIDQEKRELWLITIFSTFAYIFLNSFIVNYLYPKYSAVKIEIHSEHIDKIFKHLDSSGYHHGYQYRNIFSGYVKKDKKVITTVMLLLEVKEFVKEIKLIDPHVWILEMRTRRVFGKINTEKVE